ncbi:MAG: hypothetical protein PHT33_08345, partial [bacterium]|nr:hypothetical protein [bacterium]
MLRKILFQLIFVISIVSFCCTGAFAVSFQVDAQSPYSQYWNVPANQAYPYVDFSDMQSILPPIHGVVACSDSPGLIAGFEDDLKLAYDKGDMGKPYGRIPFQAAGFYYNTSTQTVTNTSVYSVYNDRIDAMKDRGLEPCFMVLSFTPHDVRTSPSSPSCWPDYITYPTDPIFDGTHPGCGSYVLPFGHFDDVREFYRIVAATFRGRVDHWQIGGESMGILAPGWDAAWGSLMSVRDQYFSVQGFFEYYRHAVEGILEGNPDATVGFCGFCGDDYKLHRMQVDHPAYYNYMIGLLDPNSPSYNADIEFPYLALFLDYCADNTMTVDSIIYDSTRVDFVSWDFDDSVGMIAWDSTQSPQYYLNGNRIPQGTSVYNLQGSALDIDKVAKAIINARYERRYLARDSRTSTLMDAEFPIISARYETSIERTLSLTRNYQATAAMATLKQLIDAGETRAQFYAETFGNTGAAGLNYRGLIKPFNLDPPPVDPADLVRLNPAPETKTPLFFLYQMYNKMCSGRLNVTGGFEDGNNGSVSMIASRSADNKKVTLLFWNFSPQTQTVDIDVTNLPFSKGLYEY